jgi:hypothetical protein
MMKMTQVEKSGVLHPSQSPLSKCNDRKNPGFREIAKCISNAVVKIYVLSTSILYKVAVVKIISGVLVLLSLGSFEYPLNCFARECEICNPE